MPDIKNLKKIETLEGVEQYIVTDHDGSIIAKKANTPDTMARIVCLCGKSFHAIGKSNFKHAVFSRKNKKNLFVFPVGKYYLGVIKQKEIENFIMIDAIVNFLTEIMKKDRKTRRPI
ncbi:MAG: roadblock/LC7 domain-containing protein [Desulfobacula sp.]|nr:roadblock/LC7 domain-containing protein [Desulfobacula sp.]